jgi:hypothetical protein
MSIQSVCIPFTTKTDSYSEFSRCRKTNILLKKAGIADKLDEMTKDEVAKALGVDAVISGTFESEQSKSEGAAIATAVLLGFWRKTGSGSLTMTINNGKDGEMLWRFFRNE